MILRHVIFAAGLVCSSAQAQSYRPAHLPGAGGTPLIQIQDHAAKPNVWRSTTTLLQHFPFLSPEDCASYGRKDGYPECTGTRIAPEPQNVSAPPDSDAGASPNHRAGKARANAETDQKVAKRVPVPTRRILALQDAAGSVQNILESLVISGTQMAGAKDADLRDTVRRLLIVAFEGGLPSDAGPRSVKQALRSVQVAGVFIRGDNVENTPQLHELTASLSEPGNTPAIVMIDSSAGAERAFAQASGLESIPTAREVGAIGDALGAFELYRDMAAELSTLGITMNLGASADVCPQDAAVEMRNCFGSAPLPAAVLATAFTLAHEESHVLTAMRYTLSAEHQASVEILREMLKRKGPDALVIGSGGPAALDRETTARFISSLRAAGFADAVILDRSETPADEAGLADALEAGADMIIMPNGNDQDADATTLAIEGVRSALDSGKLTRSRLDEAGKRADALTARLKAWAPDAMSQSGDTTSSIGGHTPH